jgi:hypothetical protein
LGASDNSKIVAHLSRSIKMNFVSLRSGASHHKKHKKFNLDAHGGQFLSESLKQEAIERGSENTRSKRDEI